MSTYITIALASFSIACSLYAIVLSRRTMRDLRVAALARTDFVPRVVVTPDWPPAREAAARYSHDHGRGLGA